MQGEKAEAGRSRDLAIQGLFGMAAEGWVVGGRSDRVRDVRSTCDLHFARRGVRCIEPAWHQEGPAVVGQAGEHGQAVDRRRKPGIAGLRLAR
jgi:hypothetical protein